MKRYNKVILLCGDQRWKSRSTLNHRGKGLWGCFSPYEILCEVSHREPPKMRKWLFIIKDEYLIIIV